jgi:HPt (histidine-containing phosphotransfer) domain-containing protein
MAFAQQLLAPVRVLCLQTFGFLRKGITKPSHSGTRGPTEIEFDWGARQVDTSLTSNATSEARSQALAEPVDLGHLSRYTLNERRLEREVLELFCTQSVVYIERLRQAGCDREWREAAHSLKGSALGIGAWDVAGAAERAEGLEGDNLARTRRARLSEVETSVREAKGFIRDLLRSERS